MRIALISDIHANALALQAVFADIDKQGVQKTICLGDVATLGPHPEAVIDMLGERGCPCILGNHDAFLLDSALIHSYTEAKVVVDAVDWCRSRLSTSELNFFRSFVPSLRIPLEKDSTLLLFHGSPRSHMEDLLCTTPPEQLDAALATHSATVMAGGHTHIQMLRQHRGILLVNPGSVGLAFKEYVAGQAPTLLPHAEYAVVESIGDRISVQLHRIPLDKSALRAAAAATDNPLSPMLVQQYA